MRRISINQFAEYSTAKKESTKLRIIRQQKVPDRTRIPWYQLAKARIKKSINTNGDLSPVYEAIEILKTRIPEKKWQKIDKVASIEALERFLGLKLPRVIFENNLEVLRLERSSFEVKGVLISISPDFVFRFKDKSGNRLIGAIKVHCGKKEFSLQTAELASTILYRYLQSNAGVNEKVDPNNCIIIDIFGNRVVSTPVSIAEITGKVERLCEEIVGFWDFA
ncbi:MAG: hypothetical protein AB2L20_08885 [Mangrovibacterium sp.]